MNLRDINKYILLTLTSMLFASMALSCKDDESVFVVEGSGSGKNLIIATLGSDTRAYDGHFSDDPFAEGNYEEAINRAELFFFESANDTQKAFHHISVKDIKKITRAELTVKIPMTKIEFFKRSGTSDERKAYVYAIVNLPDRSELPSDEEATLENLENIRIEDPGFTSATAPAEFVMRGGQDVTLTDDNGEATIKGWIPVSRVAAKVRMFCNIQQYVYLDKDGKTIYRNVKEDGTLEDDDTYLPRAKQQAWEVWESLPQTEGVDEGKDNTFLYFYNFTTNAQLNGSSGGRDSEGNFSRHNWLTYDNIDRSENRINLSRVVKNEDINVADYNESIAGTNKVDKDRYPYTHEWAYYSYPNAWNSYDIEEQHATNVTMRLQWKRIFFRENESDPTYDKVEGHEPDEILSEYFYYQIPVNRLSSSSAKDNKKEDNDRIDSNMYYRILIDIAMLGARDLGTPIEVDASWEAIPWSNATVDVNIKGRRYLVVNQTEWTMNNVSSINIPFSSSHDVEITNCYVNYFRYNEVWGTDNESRAYTYTGSENAIQSNWGNLEHNSTEFRDWLDKADEKKLLKKDGEGEIWLEKNGFNRLLYFKNEYFYDSVYNLMGRHDDLFEPKYSETSGAGYKYYVGHEKPYTYQNQEDEKYLVRPSVSLTGLPEQGWNEFEKIYGQGSKIYSCTVDNENYMIRFDHPLVLWKDTIANGNFYYYPETKNGKLRNQFSRVEVVIKLKHIDRPTGEGLFEETIYITQYPGIYIEVSHDYSNPKYKGDRTAYTEYNQYVSVNGHKAYPTNNRGDNEWAYVNFWQMFSFAGNNCNPNMYVIHTTQLSDEYPSYIIGDPRSLYYNLRLSGASNNDNSQLLISYNKPLVNTEDVPWIPGIVGPQRYWLGYDRFHPVNRLITYREDIEQHQNVITKTNQYLSRYYPADETGFYEDEKSDRNAAGTKINYIAPSFRIASSFGKTYSNNLEVARRRCAVYQEAGRPAGRWRLPTKSEVEFIAILSADQKIPVLFGNSQDKTAYGNYWTAQGKIRVNSQGDVEYPGTGDDFDFSPRCVYDEWYWNKIDQDYGYRVAEHARETEFFWGDVDKDNPQKSTTN